MTNKPMGTGDGMIKCKFIKKGERVDLRFYGKRYLVTVNDFFEKDIILMGYFLHIPSKQIKIDLGKLSKEDYDKFFSDLFLGFGVPFFKKEHGLEA